MKKYLIIAAAAALALASCAKVETYKVNNEQVPIGFTNYNPRSLTKVDVGNTVGTDNKLVAGSKFGVFAWPTANGTAFDGTGTPSFMNNVAVTYADGGDTDATKNTYSPMRYWPTATAPEKPSWLSFFSYYPVASGVTAPANGLGDFEFTAQSTAATQVDFMIADVKNDLEYGTATGEHIAVDGVVPFVFKHQLTKVQFYFKTGVDENGKELDPTVVKVTLKTAELRNIITNGKVNVSYAGGTTTIAPWAAADAPATATFADLYAGSGLELAKTAKTPAGAAYAATYPTPAAAYLMVPQTLKNDGAVETKDAATNEANVTDQILKVTYEVEYLNTDNGSGANNKDTFTAYTSLKVIKDGTDTEIPWNKNTIVTYTIALGKGLHPVLFTANVTDWAEEKIGGINI